ncbi:MULTISPECIES: siderophore-interacting protein [Kitasatospora]|uniref:Siderophore-interacting protein n=1 Tax=Kitasatospora cystarginea TaxID=58350 RepID=A0ABN3DFI8_9ACTN
MATELAPVTSQFRLFAAEVVRTCRLGPTMTRITFGGEQLKDFASGGRDQSFSLFLPRPGQREPVVPARFGESWYADWRAIHPERRAVMRSYTIRAQRPELAELDVDFALHGAEGPAAGAAAGPAARWAARASAGDRVCLLGPAMADNRSVGFRPPAGTDWVLLAADETGLPAVGGILDWLPAGTRARVWIEVPSPEDIQDLPSSGEVEITWLIRNGRSTLPDAIRAAELPDGSPYAWIAGESGLVKAVRRYLVGELGIDRRLVNFSGYWRKGVSEEDLRVEARA